MLSLKDMLDLMDVPELRKTDLSWLSRNLAIRNKENPWFEAAMKKIKEGLREAHNAR